MPEDLEGSIDFADSNTQVVEPETHKLFKWVIQSGTKIVIITEILVLVLLGIRLYLDQNLTNLSTTLENKREEYFALKDVEEKHVDALPTIHFLESIKDDEIDWKDFIVTFTQKFPGSLVLNKITYSAKGIEFEGSINSAFDFGVLIKELIKDDEIKQLYLEKSIYNSKDKLFEIKVEIGLTEETVNAGANQE